LQKTVDQLKKGEKGVILSFNIDKIPLKLIEMGCMEGHLVELIQVAPFGDPIYLDMNGTHLAIRKEMAREIVVEIF
jgi:ferrous iron transport protein A